MKPCPWKTKNRGNLIHSPTFTSWCIKSMRGRRHSHDRLFADDNARRWEAHRYHPADSAKVMLRIWPISLAEALSGALSHPDGRLTTNSPRTSWTAILMSATMRRTTT
jgi:hypothetical protein